MAGRSLFSVPGSEGRNLLFAVLEKLSQWGWKGTSLRDILQAVRFQADFPRDHFALLAELRGPVYRPALITFLNKGTGPLDEKGLQSAGK